MPTTDLLRQYGLSRNPFTDRTAEKTELDFTSMYIHSDLQNFSPSETTFLFFGRRGSGKTTIRLAMQRSYEEYNARQERTLGHFLVDMCKPGHMTTCLKDFQNVLGGSNDNWDACFVENWTSADLVDCIYAFAINKIVKMLTSTDVENKPQALRMLDRLRSDPRIAKSFLVLAHLYARTDAASLKYLRSQLRTWSLLDSASSLTAPQAVGSVVGLVGAASVASLVSGRTRRGAAGAAGSDWGLQVLESHAPIVVDRPLLCAALTSAVLTAGFLAYRRAASQASLARAGQLQSLIRVVKQRPQSEVAALLDSLFTSKDTVDTIRQMHIGVSAHQKLEHLTGIVKLLGYESVCVFGDCFDEVTLLDPVQYPGAIKAFAKEVCRNDLLNFGRLHFFFPDSRLALDLNTDKTLKEARFDRHFVRDIVWSRHQLQELAERRFRASQEQYGVEPSIPGSRSAQSAGKGASGSGANLPDSFSSLFHEVNGEDFASYVGKLQTPRELLIMMTEMFGRIEANPEGKLKAQDMEFAVNKAKEQAV